MNNQRIVVSVNLKRTIKIMKLTVLMLVVCLSQMVASTYAQTTKLTVSAKNETLENVLKQIEKQSEFLFFYNLEEINKNEMISISKSNVSIQDLLNAIALKTGLKYTIKDRHIVLSVNSQNTITQQKHIVSGVVKDVTGEPIIGANVLVKGSTNGTITNIDGKFNLETPSNAILQITYIGYITQNYPLNGKNNITISLKEDTQSIDEVIVVGYGTQKKANLTGAVESIKSSRIGNKPVTTLMQAMAGEAAGVTITQNTGQPKADQGNIRIRGIGTWQNADPLVLVDGVAMSINDIVPSDVESISILKDAASASIYGSRAANGVVLITTKKGEKGKISLSYTGNVGFQTPTRTPQMVESWQYGELYNQSMKNEGKSSSLFPQDRIERMKNGGDPDQLEGNTDWYKEFLRSAALQHSHNATLTGGCDRITYLASLGYMSQDGVIPNSSYERYNLRINTTTEITSWFKLGINLAYLNGQETDTTGDSEDIDSNGGSFNAFQRVGRAVPYMPVKYSDGTWSYLSAPTNPVRMVTDDYGRRIKNSNNISTLITPEFNPIEGLNIKGMFAYESSSYRNKQFNKTVDYKAFEPAGQVGTNVVARNKQTDKWEQWNNLTASATVNYEKQINTHYFKVMAGGSLETFKWAFTKASRRDFPNNNFSEINAGDPNTASAEGNSTKSALASVFGRLNYSFADRYLVEANLRYDGSSKFAKGNRFGLFPSFSVGWRISEEVFFENIKTIMPSLKIRASWGQLGNQQIDDYQYFSTYGAGDSYLFGNTISTGYAEKLMGNPDITWETSTNLNLGIDFSLFDNRLQATFDWYKRNTDDILLSLKAPKALGIDAPMQNAGSVQNKGWDLSINWHDKIGSDFNYFIGFNLSDVRNEITDLKGYKSPTGDLKARIEGEPIDALFGWETLGICTTQEQYEKYKDVMQTYNGNWNIGDIIIKDRNDDGKIGSEDKTVIGNSIPRFTFGVNLGFDYKNFDFSCFFQGVGKADGYVKDELIIPMGIYSALKDHYTDSFNPENPNPNAYFPRITNSWMYNYGNMQHWVQNASYIRLKNLQVGYTFDIAKMGIEKVRLMVSGENLFTLTKFKIWDPETKVGERSTYPHVAVYSFGVNLIF